jgi:thiamine biosynthesis lipoprotein
VSGHHHIHWPRVLGGDANAFAWPVEVGRATEPALRELLARFQARVSRFEPDSDTSRLNDAAGRPVDVGTELRETLAASEWAAELTGGVVDGLVGTSLHRAGYAAGGHPPRVDVRTVARPADRPAQAAASTRPRLTVSGETACVPAGERYDPGGVGKGLIADRALALLRDAGATSALVELSGDLVGFAEEHPWPVRVDPYDDGELVAELELHDGAVATSAITRRAWIDADGALQHHLRCPRSGEPVFGPWVAVTALAPTCLEAETRSKWAYLTADTAPLVHGGYTTGWDGRITAIGGVDA